VAFTASGSSARLIARFRPPAPILAFTGSATVARQLNVGGGVRSIPAPPAGSTGEIMALKDRTLLEMRCLKPRDSVVFVAGQPIGRAGSTNLMKLHRVGESRRSAHDEPGQAGVLSSSACDQFRPRRPDRPAKSWRSWTGPCWRCAV
jgi:pyruvate kinase